MSRGLIASAVVVGGLVLGALAVGAHAQDLSTWNRKLEDGLKAAKKSGKPVLVVTNWKPDI